MKSVLALSLVLVALAACSAVPAGGGGSGGGSGGSGPGTATGPGITVDQALASTLSGPLLVNGALFVMGDQARLCGAIAESYPPQCGGQRLIVEGLDLSAVAGLQTEGALSWAEQVQILGTVKDGVLTVTQGAR